MLFKSIIVVSLFVTEIAFSQTQARENHFLGLKPITTQEQQILHQNRVNFINPNKMGLKRLNEHRRKVGLPDLPESAIKYPEFGNANTNTNTNTSVSTTILNEILAVTLPASVDNSNDSTKSFPAIGDQGRENSCASWATTYYMMSHEVCLATAGCDNQTVGSTTSRIFSPRWTYNQINNGVDNGSYFSSAFSLIANHGAATLTQLPYVAGDYLRWDLNAQDWRSAIWSRVGAVQSIPINTDSGMQLVKQSLVNGHVMVMGTYIDSWILNTIAPNPSAAANPFVGQKIVTYQNGTISGHAMTIVGYDDTVWTDINGNGVVDSGELGAFKIANSWGTNYGNNGFIWASYDSFRTTSLVPNFAPANRIELTQTGSAYQTPYTSYSPKLLARANLSHLKRRQISFQLGSSANTSSTPTSKLTLTALQNAGGDFAFNGTTSEVSGRFYFDISSLVGSAWNQQRFYFIPTDNTSGDLLTVSNFDVVDPTTDAVLLSANGVPATLDASAKTFAVGDLISDTQPPTVPANLTAKKALSITRKVNLLWQASTDNVQLKSYLLYRNGVLLSTLGATVLSYTDTYNLKSGIIYTYIIKAVDTSSNSSALSNSASVKF